MDKRTQAIENIRQWKANPVQFVRNVFQCEPDLWQQDVLMKFATSQRIAMQASKGVVKSTTLAWCIWNFILTRPHPKIAITSISADNLRDGLGAELSKFSMIAVDCGLERGGESTAPDVEELIQRTEIFDISVSNDLILTARRFQKK